MASNKSTFISIPIMHEERLLRLVPGTYFIAAVPFFGDGIKSVKLSWDAAEAFIDGSKSYDEVVDIARELYTKKAWKTEQHHLDPKHIGGDPDGPTVPLDGAYHQLITKPTE